MNFVALFFAGTEIVRMSNGLTLAFEQNPRADFLAVMSITNVSHLSPIEKGALEVIAFSLTQETESFSQKEFQRLTWYVGGKVEAQLVGDVFQIKIATHKSHFGPSITILSELLQRGLPGPEALEKGTSVWKSWLNQSKHLPLFVAMRSVRLALGLGLSEELDLRLSFCKNVFLKAIRPESTVISVIGEIDPQFASQRIQNSLGNWIPAKPIIMRPVITYRNKIEHSVNVNIITLEGPKPSDKTFPAWLIGTQLIGGGKGSELYDLIRTKMGIGYLFGTTYSFSESHSYAYFCVPTFRTQKSEVEGIANELQKLIRNSLDSISGDKVKRAKNYFKTFRFAGELPIDSRISPFNYSMSGSFEIGFDVAWGLLFNVNINELVNGLDSLSSDEVRATVSESVSSMKSFVFFAK